MGKIYSANVGDRFIIEIGAIADVQGLGADNDNIDTLYKVKGFNSLVFDDNGIKKLAKAKDLKDEVKEAYKKGYAKAMEDIQKAIRTLLAMGYGDRDLYFGGSHITAEILSEFDVREIVERLEAYKKEQSKIKVGDEVKVENSGGYLGKAIVTYVDKYEKEIYVVFAGGSAGEITDGTRLRKTGRHFDEVEKLIEVLKGGEDSDKVSF